MQPQEPNTEQESKKEVGLKTHTIWLMVAVALLYDVVTILLPSIVAPVAALHFYLWFKLNNISFMTPKRLVTGSTGLLIEAFPLTSWLPAWTATVLVVALDSKIKKKLSI